MNKTLSWLIAAAFSTTAWAQSGINQTPAYPETGNAPKSSQHEYPDLPLNSDPSAYPGQPPSHPGSQSSGSSMKDSRPATGMQQHGMDGQGMRGQPEMRHGQGQNMPPMQDGNRAMEQGARSQSDTERSGAPAPMSTLKPVTENGFTYLCGGIGSDESAQMKKSARDYDLMLTFASRKGNYLADIDVDISGKNNASLQATCDAPIMLVDFPKSGSYQIKATTNGKALTRNTSVKSSKGHKALVMVWPD